MKPSAPTGALPDILQAAVPRPEILQSDLGDAMFAADFAEVVSGRASAMYTDPEQFFSNTHPTEPLKKIVRTVFRPLKDPSTLGGTIRLSTGFGGGKSHTLITLWHLAQAAGRDDIGTELLTPAERPATVKVVAIDASKAGTPEFTRHGDRAIGSFWGEVFWQLAGDRGLAVLGEADRPDASPNEPQLDAVLPDGPVLILIDELVVYMKKLESQAQGNLLGFLNLLAAKSSSRAQMMLVITDPAAQHAYAAESELVGKQLKQWTQEEQKQSAAAEAMDDLISRKGTDYDAIGSEAAQVIVRRLFSSVDQNVAQAVQREYEATYERLLGEGHGDLPADAMKQARQIAASYPFHPRLLQTVQDRLGAIPGFQRSRGTLRLFARILRSISDRKTPLSLITAGDIDWSDDRILGDLLSRLDREPFRAAVSADVRGHAQQLDGDTRGVHVRAASALLLESLPNEQNSSLTRPGLTLAILRPDEGGSEPGEALDHLINACWHIYPAAGNDGYQFRHQPNISKQIEERMTTVSRADARHRVLEEAANFYKEKDPEGLIFDLHRWPAAPHIVPDQKKASLTLVLTEQVETAQQIVKLSDTRDGPGQEKKRLYRNAILAVAAEAGELENSLNRAQRLIAAELIQKDHEDGDGTLAKLTMDQLKKRLPELQKAFRMQVRRAFTQVVMPGRVDALEEEYQVGEDEFIQGGRANVGQRNLGKFLRDKGRVYMPTDALDPALFLQQFQGMVPQPDGSFSTQAAQDRLLQSQGLPRLVSGDSLLRNAVRKAVDAGRIVLRTEHGDAQGLGITVGGPAGSRRELQGRGPVLSFNVDDKTFIAPAESEVAKTWLKVDAVSPPDSGGDHEPEDDDGGNPPPPPPPGKNQPLSTFDRLQIKRAAQERKVNRITLKAADPATAQGIASLLPTLNIEHQLNLTIQGKLQDGELARFELRGVRVNHALKPLETARTLVRSCQPQGLQYSAEFIFTFSPPAAGDIAAVLADKIPEKADIQAEFGAKP